MLTIIDAASFFGSDRPRGIPLDAPVPDEAALFSRARTLAVESSRYPLDALKDILLHENIRIGAADPALDTVRSIGPGAVFVVAGQQSGLFGGPLYTLYKGLHAVRLARRIRKATGVNAIPVFWVASDDHDFVEVRSIGVRASDGGPFRVEYEPKNRTEGAPVGEIMLDDGIGEAVNRLAGRLAPGERADSYTGLLRRSWKPGTRWSDAFSAQMAGLLSRTGLVMLDPRWAGVKRLFAGVMRAEIENPLASSARVNEEADRIESKGGRTAPLRRGENATNLFLETGGVRRALLFEDGVFLAGDGRFSPDELLALLDAEPERFSPAAALRPVCQDALMPVAALIGGPGMSAS
jgi:bacillithiol synthase